jgi:hypothetical protein
MLMRGDEDMVPLETIMPVEIVIRNSVAKSSRMKL